MPDSTVARWRQRGRIYTWHFRDNVRNYPGWHLTADPDGCQSLLELFTLMQEAQYSSRNTLRISEPPPHVVAVANYGSRWYSASSIEIRYPKDRVDHETWELKATKGKILIILGKAKLDDFKAGIQDIQNGGGDYAITLEDDSEDMELWFWWHRNSDKDLMHP